MQKGSRVLATLLICLTLFNFFSSCNSSSKFSGKTGKFLVGPIRITGYVVSSSTLILKDQQGNNASYIRVNRNQPINWVVTKSDLQIIDIAPDPKYPGNEPTFFSALPHQQGDPKHWQATVGYPDSTKGFVEEYFIKWKRDGDDSTYTYDPLIQLNPK